MSRHARQMQLPEIGAAGQARLAAAHVLVVGAGGLGCPVLSYLGGAGVGHLTVIDPDHVELGNLHRQPLYSMDDLGQPKADAARQRLLAANPDLQITALVAPLGPDTAPDLIAAADLVVDAADSFAVSYILSDICLAQDRPLISASVLGQAGYVGGFCGGAPSLRAVFPDLPERGATCATAGVMGPAVGMIGAMQAQMALQVLLGQDRSPLGQLLHVDALGWQMGGFRFDGAPEPENPVPFLSRADFAPQDQVIDLRPMDEAPVAASPNARRLLPEDLRTADLDLTRRVVLCCASGLRAWHGAHVLRARGVTDLALWAAQSG